MITWQKKVQKIVRQIGEESGFSVKKKEEKFRIRTERLLEDYDDEKKILHYAVIPDVIWTKGKKKYNFEIEEKTDKWLIGTIMNGVLFSLEKNTTFILIVKSEKQGKMAWNYIRVLEDKIDSTLPTYYVMNFSDKSYEKLKKEAQKELREL